MESFATLIQNRRSTRKFTEQLLSPEQVELILKAALMLRPQNVVILGSSWSWKIRKC